MTNLQAAVGLAQFEHIDEFVNMRRKNAQIYEEFLSGVPGIRLPVEKDWAKSVYWMFSVLVEPEFGLSRDGLIDELAKRGVETRPFFTTMNEQPVFRNMNLFEVRKVSSCREFIEERAVFAFEFRANTRRNKVCL